MSGPGERRWTGRRVLIALLLFFGIVAAVNGAMIWAALESWPGRSSMGEAPRVTSFAARDGGTVSWTG